MERHDPRRLRRVFGAFPTGITVVAAVVDGAPAGLAVSSFTSVSLEPALVSVCVGTASATWPALRRAARLGVSILSAEQESAGRQLAARCADRFAGLSWRTTMDGAIVLDGACGWFDVSVVQQVRAGDHDIVVLAVHDLDASHETQPLVFHASQFRRLQA
jgi:flavin reductase (DIM6/NTAB) family NADH-FMN oxidoreductase RutF